MTSRTIECQGCHFCVHAACTTYGICLQCAERELASPAHLGLKACKFNCAWRLTRPWLQYDVVCVLMWCEACRAHPQLGSSVPFVQGTSNFKFFTIKEDEKSGTHNVSVALWRSGEHVTAVIRMFAANLQEGIMALFRAVYRIVQHYAPLRKPK